MTTLTAGAERARAVARILGVLVATRHELSRIGVDENQISTQLQAGRWRQLGSAIVLHNGRQSRDECERVATINCGPRAVLTSFTSVAEWGLNGWGRREVHVLAPAGTTRPTALHGLVLHRTRDWGRADIAHGRRLHRLAPSLVLAASSFTTSRPGCGILAAGVQQRLCGADELLAALDAAPRVRHRRALVRAVHDIAQGAEALSEIDLRTLCRKYHLPLPTNQAVRVEPSGRRRYLDAEWRLPDGRVVAVEVDGALHLAPKSWIDDQLRQNEIVLGGTLVLRFPSVVVRDSPLVVAMQLRCALGLT